MHQETISGLHKCQPKNAPEAGTIKNMVVLNMPAKNGKKAWIKIKSEKPEKGGSPYRILGVDKLDWPPDDYGNIAFNLEVEASSNAPSAFQQARSAMLPTKAEQEQDADAMFGQDPVEHPQTNVKPPVARSNGGDGVTEARKHLMRACNLYNLCIAAADKAIAPNMPEIGRTSEQFQSTLASLWIEASGRRSTNGVDWWSYIDKMPDTPIKAEPKSKPACTCDNTDGDNPLCPVHSE